VIYWACSTNPVRNSCPLTSYVHQFNIFRLSMSVDSINAQNSFLFLVMRSTLLASQVTIFFFWNSRWALVFRHWNRIWPMIWYSLSHVHVASSLMWKRFRSTFVIPCLVSTADIFGVSFILDLRLPWTVCKYCLFAEDFCFVVHSRYTNVCMYYEYMSNCMYVWM